MKTGLWLVVAILSGTISSMAEIPAPVLNQLREDIRGAMLIRGESASEENVARELLEIETKAAEPGSLDPDCLVFSVAEVMAFEAGMASPIDATLDRGVDEIRRLIGEGNKLPHLLSYYESLRAQGTISPQQRILHQRICRITLAGLRKALARP